MAAELNELAESLRLKGYSVGADIIQNISTTLNANKLIPPSLKETSSPQLEHVINLNQPIGPQIKNVRLSRGLTQSALAELTQGGIDRTYITKLERSNSMPQRKRLIALANSLNASIIGR